MSRALKVLAPLLLVAAMATPARADMFIATGLKWNPTLYTKAVGASVNGNTVNTFDLAAWNSTSLDSYIAFYFMDQVGIHLSVDFGWANFNRDTPGNTGNINFNSSYFQLGFGVGAKFYLTKPAKQKVVPYLWANFFKYFAAINTTDSGTGVNDVVGYLASLRSPIGFEVAFGAEYFLSNGFSLGAEILGLRFAHSDGSFPIGTGGRQTDSNNIFNLYGAISLNYRFGIGGGGGGGGRSYEDEGRPVRRPRRPPPEEGSPDQVE